MHGIAIAQHCRGLIPGQNLSVVNDSASIVRSLVIYGIVLPLAIFLGWTLGHDWDQGRSYIVTVGIIVSIICLPLLLRWHHLLLFLSWNTPALVFFLPGSPEFWIFMALLSFLITITHRALDSSVRMFPVPSVVWPLLFILAVVLGTAQLNGGIHLNSFGGSSDMMGGKRYIYMIAGVIGFFAMTSHFIPAKKTSVYMGGFLLGNMTNLIPNLVPYLGFGFPILFNIFPIDLNTYGAISAASSNGQNVSRNYGLSISLCWAFFYMLARYGIKNLFSIGNYKKLILLFVFFVGGMLGGFRSFLLLMLMTAFFLFWFEGLFRSRYVVILMGLLAAFLVLLPFSKSLPSPIQRAVCVLPGVEVDPAIRREAEASSEWRIQMWKNLLPEIPKYFWLGKGLGINATEYWSEVNLEQQARGNNEATTYMMSGDYHNGPLSVIIPFGIWGLLGWLWFLAVSVRLLYLNYRNGDPAFKTINCFLIAHFIARIILFFVIFGGFYSDLAFFVGLVGFSISLNGGMRRQAPAPVVEPKITRRKLPVPTRLAPNPGN